MFSDTIKNTAPVIEPLHECLVEMLRDGYEVKLTPQSDQRLKVTVISAFSEEAVGHSESLIAPEWQLASLGIIAQLLEARRALPIPRIPMTTSES